MSMDAIAEEAAKIAEKTRKTTAKVAEISLYKGQISTLKKRKTIVDRRREDILNDAGIVGKIKSDLQDAGDALTRGIQGADGPSKAAQEMLNSAGTAYDIGKTNDADHLGSESYRLSRKVGQLESDLNSAEYDLRQISLED